VAFFHLGLNQRILTVGVKGSPTGLAYNPPTGTARDEQLVRRLFDELFPPE